MGTQSSEYGLDDIRAISYFSTSLHDKGSVEEVLWDVTQNVIHQLGFIDCVIYRMDYKDKVLLQQAAFGQKNPSGTQIYNRITIALGDGIVGSVARSGKPELVNDTSRDARYIVDDEPRLSELCVPIFVDGQLFGLIDSEHPEKNFYTQRHLYLLTIIAALCAQKIKEMGSGGPKRNYTQADTYFRKLEQLMEREKLYRNPDFCLGMAAHMLDISPCYLSSMVNAVIEHSFIDYINGYRVAEVKRNLRSEEYDHYTILSVGLEAGFNSRSAFYNAFKKHTGVTPSRFRDGALNGWASAS